MRSVACTTSLMSTVTQVRKRRGAFPLPSLSFFLTPVMMVRFAYDDKTRLASASRDGTLSVFSLTSEPPSLSATLRGHTKAINGGWGPLPWRVTW